MSFFSKLLLAPLLLFGLVTFAACADDAAAPPLDAARVDLLADASVPDRGVDLLAVDFLLTDASSLPLPGFGALAGACGVLDDEEWNAKQAPFFFRNVIDFGTTDFDQTKLSSGGLKVFTDGNLGGNSLHSEVFSFEALYRCELAKLLKTEREIAYLDAGGKKTDLLVEIDGRKVGVSVTRAFHFPAGQPYTEAEATKLLEGKLADVLLSNVNAKPEDAWQRALLHVIAADAQHADMVKTAYDKIDAAVRANTILLVTVTDGKDDYIY